MLIKQLSILDQIAEGERLRDAGIKTALDHANAVSPDWSERALNLVRDFLKYHRGEFMVEDLRSYAAMQDNFPLPTNARSWGGIIKKAEKEGLVRRLDFSATKNPKAHRTPASVWIKNN
jgi:hypothetical protein